MSNKVGEVKGFDLIDNNINVAVGTFFGGEQGKCVQVSFNGGYIMLNETQAIKLRKLLKKSFK